ncbi:hypothetical protein B0H66DRAFT_304842 [Apodospora peruviana]|uniref:RING-type domain-containing protein n=1 Tax=Apodospora peruviana TaxID=516989 RepID=A0AAE0I1U2_9PEZI|nr:hypothetical protein B0H66DRAFT_304842 [Apodospora peruviana]
MATCKACNDPLVLPLDLEGDSGDEGSSSQTQHQETVPDDLEMQACSCHFHWQCLLDQSSAVVSSLTCPACNTYLPSNSSGSSSSSSQPPQQKMILTNYTNEGGLQTDLNILSVLTEEAFLSTHPESRPARAMHTMAAEGDVAGLLELVGDIDSDPDVEMTASQLLVWRDPLNGGRGVLHVAVEARQEEVFWLLLWVGSGLATNMFPQAVMQAAGAMGLSRREDAIPRNEDVRFVVDDQGRAAADVCLQMGSPWELYVSGGLFN